MALGVFNAATSQSYAFHMYDAEPTPISALPASFIPLKIQTFSAGKSCAFATGSICRFGPTDYLLTNWHVLSGCDANTGASKDGGIPTDVKIFFHRQHGPTSIEPSAMPTQFSLGDVDGKPRRWLAHPSGRAVDLALLPLTAPIGSHVQRLPVAASANNNEIGVFVSSEVSIVGYIPNLDAGGLMIWKTGHVASEPDINCDGVPKFYIDAVTQEGMSGSPVWIYRKTSYINQLGNQVLRFGDQLRVLGIYSGRQNDKFSVGNVWKLDAVKQIALHHSLGTAT